MSYHVFLQIAYGYLFMAFNIRAIIFLVGFVSVTIAHVVGVRNLRPDSPTNIMFLALTGLWVTKVVVFLINEVSAVLFANTSVPLELLDLLLLFALTLLVATSFVFRKPFWYFEPKGRVPFIFIAIILLIASGLLAASFITAFSDYMGLME
jgi:hypothetical protein